MPFFQHTPLVGAALAAAVVSYMVLRRLGSRETAKDKTQETVAKKDVPKGSQEASRTWTVTKVQAEYISSMVAKRRLDQIDAVSSGRFADGPSWMVTRLILQANNESKKTKSHIFRVVRCHNCSQSSTGGTKVGIELSLRKEHVRWMENVYKACQHASIDKTMRILLDWYMALAMKDHEAEELFFGGRGSSTSVLGKS